MVGTASNSSLLLFFIPNYAANRESTSNESGVKCPVKRQELSLGIHLLLYFGLVSPIDLIVQIFRELKLTLSFRLGTFKHQTSLATCMIATLEHVEQ